MQLECKGISRLEGIAVGNRKRMHQQQRAKQFIPFAALKGYQEALRDQELAHALSVDMPSEYVREWDCKLKQISETLPSFKI